MRTSRGLVALPALALAALLLSGCSAAVDESSDSGGMPGLGAPDAPVSEESGGGADGDLGGATDADDRSVVTTGYLYLTVEQPLDAAADAVALV